MKKLIVCATVLALTGCGNFGKKSDEHEPIRNQKLSTSFKNDTIRIETDCVWYKPWKSDCDVTSIEATATASANGNTDSNRRTALIRAGDRARASVRHFIQEDISSSRVNKTIAKNVEKARDKLNTNHGDHEVVEMSDKEAKATNVSVRENSNDTAVQLTTTVRANSTAILRGFKVVKQEVVGAQEVAVTIRWDKDGEKTARLLESKFGSGR
jgi:hypothetical protein